MSKDNEPPEFGSKKKKPVISDEFVDNSPYEERVKSAVFKRKVDQLEGLQTQHPQEVTPIKTGACQKRL